MTLKIRLTPSGVARLAKKQDGDHTFIDNETGKDIDPFGKDWSIVASALNNAGRDVMEGLGDSDYPALGVAKS